MKGALSSVFLTVIRYLYDFAQETTKPNQEFWRANGEMAHSSEAVILETCTLWKTTPLSFHEAEILLQLSSQHDV